MKTTRKKHTLSLEKFQISKLNNLRSIIGGKANNNSEEEEENEESYSTTTDTWTTITQDSPSIGG